jgi:hypothetical protein
MSVTKTDRWIRLCVPEGRIDPAGLSLEELSGPLADSDVDVANVDAIEIGFEGVESAAAAIEVLESLAEGGGDVRIQELVVEVHR